MNDTTKKEPLLRRYVVLDKDGKERLVKATGQTTAIGHVYFHHCRVATADDVERLIVAGVATELA